MDIAPIAIAGLTIVCAAAVCAVLIFLLLPMLRRHVVARPNARSSHRTPTPQGGGIAVMGATIIVVVGAIALMPAGGETWRLATVLGAAVALAVIGALDDVHTLEAVPRLLLQAIVTAVVIAALPAEFRIFQILPWWLERALLLLAGLWFVNLVNFMDGIDWITAAEVVPLTAGLAAFGVMGQLTPQATIVALALCGAMIGFAPFNRPVAKLFLGDVGSLPVGLLLGWLLVEFAGRGHITAAFLLPLYYLADTTITLFRRLAHGEPVMQAHRTHYYQQATDGGFSVIEIVGRIFVLNVALVALAATTLVNSSRLAHVAALLLGCALVGILLWQFAHGKNRG